MKKMNKRMQVAGAVAVIILAAGCASETITAEYVMPPRAVSNIKAIDTMEIISQVKVSDNAVGQNQDESFVIGTLNQRVAARFCQEGFFRTTDFVWGNPAGATKMGDVVLTKGNLHGYARHTTDPVDKRAKLYLTLNASIKTSHVKTNKTFVVKDVYFTRKVINKVPVGVPDPTRTRVQNVVRPVDIYTIAANGTLEVKLVNKDNQVVYTKTFQGLNASHETSPDKHEALPAKSAVIMEMLVPAVETIVADLSPHKERRSFAINESGNEKACLLLKAQAFTEAITVLDELEEKTDADLENLGLAYEVIGEYTSAKESFDSAVKLNPDNQNAANSARRMEGILSATASLRKMDAKKTDTQYKKSEFK